MYNKATLINTRNICVRIDTQTNGTKWIPEINPHN